MSDGKKRKREIIDQTTEGMGANGGGKIGLQILLACPRQRTVGGIGDLIKAVGDFRRESDGAITGNGPGRGGPDHHETFQAALNDGAFHIDLRRGNSWWSKAARNRRAGPGV